MTTVGEVGEFGLIERLAKQVDAARLPPPAHAGFRLRLGIGDDAAAWQTDGGVEVQTTDTMVEDVHFTRASVPWEDVGWKIMAANLSDVAAMGAVPLCALVTLGLPPTLGIDAIDGLYAGLLEACARYPTQLVGGDIVRAEKVFITVALVGACHADPLTRSAARPGDVVAVTGSLGASAGGLRLLGAGTLGVDGHSLLEAHRRPQPRIDAGQHILLAGVRCAMDISDGLVADLGKLGRASGVSVRVQAQRVPVAPALAAQGWPDALNLALSGGEDYELVFTAPERVITHILEEVPGAIIGEVTADEPGSVRVVDAEGAEMTIDTQGWDHLASAAGGTDR